MSKKPHPVSTPLPLTLGQALAESEVLASLGQRVRHSQACLTAVQAVMPAQLRGLVSAGPYDEQGWTLLCSSAAAAAKLRQLMPSLNQALQDAGLCFKPIRLHILPK